MLGTHWPVSRILSNRCPPSRTPFGLSSIWDACRHAPQAAYPHPDPRVADSAWGGRRILLGLAPREVYLAIPVAWNAGGRLLHHFTHHLYPGLPGPSAGLLSAARAVAGYAYAFLLGSTVPCGVRTFLTAHKAARQSSQQVVLSLFGVNRVTQCDF